MRYTLRQAALPCAILVVASAGLMAWYCDAWGLDETRPTLVTPEDDLRWTEWDRPDFQ